jgi:hypothetical protein
MAGMCLCAGHRLPSALRLQVDFEDIRALLFIRKCIALSYRACVLAVGKGVLVAGARLQVSPETLHGCNSHHVLTCSLKHYNCSPPTVRFALDIPICSAAPAAAAMPPRCPGAWELGHITCSKKLYTSCTAQTVHCSLFTVHCKLPHSVPAALAAAAVPRRCPGRGTWSSTSAQNLIFTLQLGCSCCHLQQ